jgi:hypothetical protein
MEVQEQPQRLPVQTDDLQLKPFAAQPSHEGHHCAYTMAIHEIDAREVEDDVLF